MKYKILYIGFIVLLALSCSDKSAGVTEQTSAIKNTTTRNATINPTISNPAVFRFIYTIVKTRLLVYRSHCFYKTSIPNS